MWRTSVSVVYAGTRPAASSPASSAKRSSSARSTSSSASGSPCARRLCSLTAPRKLPMSSAGSPTQSSSKSMRWSAVAVHDHLVGVEVAVDRPPAVARAIAAASRLQPSRTRSIARSPPGRPPSPRQLLVQDAQLVGERVPALARHAGLVELVRGLGDPAAERGPAVAAELGRDRPGNLALEPHPQLSPQLRSAREPRSRRRCGL